ncbi:ferritin-like domain-containing protein [Desulfoscipio gibsoniae]|uniref:Uncharacterized protein n=1 Tax=Desulfoscipio gibsoniae DSM 7213 TaxID=767817 RepID=R4KKW1_9FIRM|nr:ferritin-like domain-containing protein [Desulfoscipio gibsoniae]AGL00276.1 hypothetical protein Desgi_0721 [Desulfoscipio gibsoniae DSM 7213]
MPWHHIVRQIIEIEKKEIALYQQIAAGAPTPALRDMICGMVEHEQQELYWWQQFLQNDCVMPGPAGGYQPGPDYCPPGGGYKPGIDCPPGYYPPGYPHPPKGWASTPYTQEKVSNDQGKVEKQSIAKTDDDKE